MAQVVECLSSKCEALNSNVSTSEEKRKAGSLKRRYRKTLMTDLEKNRVR
jgi:hypothetical protein